MNKYLNIIGHLWLVGSILQEQQFISVVMGIFGIMIMIVSFSIKDEPRNSAKK